ncbi:hypothetical protein ILYODFUR_025995, partial [Ilyodon furcidens]
GQNGNQEQIVFLTSKEKSSSKKTGILIGVLVGLFAVLSVAAFLVWFFVFRHANSQNSMAVQLKPSVKLFSGQMKLAGMSYDTKLEETTSQEFQDSAEKLEKLVSTPPIMSPIFVLLYTLLLLSTPYPQLSLVSAF